MADMKTYTVHRAMHGDGRDYERGDTRDMTEIDAAALVESGALSLEGENPAVRTSSVRHTFGKDEPTGHIAMTTATTDEKMAVTRPAKATKA